MNLRPAIVQILSDRHTTAGTGFLFSKSGLILTCSHVILSKEDQKAGNKTLPAEVAFRFLLEEDVQPYAIHKARILSKWLPFVQGDVVILQYEGTLPQGVQALSLGRSSNIPLDYDNRYITLGYPERGGIIYNIGEGKIHPNTIQSKWGFRLKSLIDEDHAITEGYSGAPVYNKETGNIIGIISWIVVADQYGKGDKSVYAIPSELIQDLYPDAITLRPIKPDAPLEALPEVAALLAQEKSKLKEELEAKFTPLVSEMADLVMLKK